jgi:hypothetical protein
MGEGSGSGSGSMLGPVTAPRAKVPPLSLVITNRWSAPLLWFQYGHVTC